jgi:hypothetical protein
MTLRDGSERPTKREVIGQEGRSGAFVPGVPDSIVEAAHEHRGTQRSSCLSRAWFARGCCATW